MNRKLIFLVFIIGLLAPNMMLSQGGLFKAIEKNNIALVDKKIQRSQHKLNWSDRTYGYTPLMLACKKGNPDIVELLIDSGCDVNVRGDNGSTALLTALEHDQLKMAYLLLERGADPTAKDEQLKTALMHAASPVPIVNDDQPGVFVKRRTLEEPFDSTGELRLQIVKILLEKEVPVYDTTDVGVTCLDFAAIYTYPRVVAELLSFSEQSDNKFSEKQLSSAFKSAVIGGNIDIVENIYGHDIDPDATDKYQVSPLIYAINGRHWDVVNFLLEEGAKSDHSLPNGYSAIAAAASANKYNLVDSLLNLSDDMLDVYTEHGDIALASSFVFSDAKMDSILLSQEKNFKIAREYNARGDSIMANSSPEEAKEYFEEGGRAIATSIYVFEKRGKQYRKKASDASSGNIARVVLAAGMLGLGVYFDYKGEWIINHWNYLNGAVDFVTPSKYEFRRARDLNTIAKNYTRIVKGLKSEALLFEMKRPE